MHCGVSSSQDAVSPSIYVCRAATYRVRRLFNFGVCDSQTTTVFERSFSDLKDLFGIEPVAERRSARHGADGDVFASFLACCWFWRPKSELRNNAPKITLTILGVRYDVWWAAAACSFLLLSVP